VKATGDGGFSFSAVLDLPLALPPSLSRCNTAAMNITIFLELTHLWNTMVAF
jgi:hypothetical protein